VIVSVENESSSETSSSGCPGGGQSKLVRMPGAYGVHVPPWFVPPRHRPSMHTGHACRPGSPGAWSPPVRNTSAVMGTATSTRPVTHSASPPTARLIVLTMHALSDALSVFGAASGGPK
jgi:hypothetical protein